MCMCVCVCVFVRVCMFLCVFVCVCVRVCMYVSSNRVSDSPGEGEDPHVLRLVIAVFPGFASSLMY